MIKLKIKKAAMFGLDARIALAIFGALSVISGAALYSAIREAKVVTIVAYMNEFSKAWEQYYFDTGTSLPQYGADNSSYDFYALDSIDLIEDNGKTGWKGPYLQNKLNEKYLLDFPKALGTGFSGTAFQLLTDPNGSSFSTRVCGSGKDCSLWIRISGLTSEVDTSLLKDIDKKIDGEDGATTGNFRWSSDGWDYGYYKISGIENPND